MTKHVSFDFVVECTEKRLNSNFVIFTPHELPMSLYQLLIEQHRRMNPPGQETIILNGSVIELTCKGERK